MVKSVIKFYDKELSSFNLVYQYMKPTYCMYLISGILFVMSLFLAMFIDNILTKVIFGIFLALNCIFYFLLNLQAKRIVRHKYDIYPDGFFWNVKELSSKRVSLLKKFLDENGINSTKKTEEFMKLLSKESENRKFKSLLVPGIVLAFTLPVWNHFIAFSFKSINNLNWAIAFVIVIVFLTISSSVLYSQIKSELIGLINHQSNKIKLIEELVGHVHFLYVLENEDNKKN
ncbi:hypothetical protein [Brevibacillus brevis]|uniref:hypothetical protein n=1 Tax=Brevibacillus brevis TaxID=1393 RepID=UPI001157647F|nr:hypothetical protein [Lysinibacillus sp. SDF0063]TQR30204.1 hypothetical protein C7Y45_27055 [Lysinibacillus sp. SDF0063]